MAQLLASDRPAEICNDIGLYRLLNPAVMDAEVVIILHSTMDIDELQGRPKTATGVAGLLVK